MPPADDVLDAVPAADPKAIIEEAMKGGGDATAILAALDKAGMTVQAGPEEPIEGQGEDETGIRPERNPPENTGTDTASMGEPMDIDQIGADLFDQYMKPGSAPAS